MSILGTRTTNPQLGEKLWNHLQSTGANNLFSAEYTRLVEDIYLIAKKENLKSNVGKPLLELLKSEVELVRRLKFLNEVSDELVKSLGTFKKAKQIQFKNLSSFTKEQLRDDLIESEVRCESQRLDTIEMKEAILYLLNYFNQTRFKHMTSTKNRELARNKKFKSNLDFLMECLNQIKADLKRDFQATDFIKFHNLAMKFKPPYIQKPRRSKQDRMMCEEIQKLDAEALARNEWAPSTLRSFFEKHTGVKPSSIRK
jgi:hypothetical protein